MEREPSKTPTPEDKEMYERWIAEGGRENSKDFVIHFEVKKALEEMAERYSNVEFAPRISERVETLADMKRKMENKGWLFEGEYALNIQISAEEALKDRLGNPDYKIIVFENRFLVFARGTHEEENDPEEAVS